MKREILFRGKRADSGEWIEGNLFIGDDGECEILIGSQIVRISYNVERETVGQYTGLTDKNGVKIFEGDIVKCKHEIRNFLDEEDKIPRFAYGVKCEEQQSYFTTTKTNTYYRNYELQFYNGRYRIINKNIIHYIDTDYIYNHEIEVIGNIYDNPEILEDEE